MAMEVREFDGNSYILLYTFGTHQWHNRRVRAMLGIGTASRQNTMPICIENHMNPVSAIRSLWARPCARVMSEKFSKFQNFQNITSDH